MAKIVFNRFLMFPNALLMLLFFTLLCIAAGMLWYHYRKGKWNRVFHAACLIFLVLLFAVGMLFGRDVKHDEIEHAHSAWLISQGALPYIDFFQHHSPLFWILITPVFKIPLTEFHICLVIRITALLFSMFALTALYFFSYRLWKQRPSFLVYMVLVCAHFLIIELNILRPDLLANLLVFSALWLLSGSQRKRNLFLSGLLMGITLALSLKYLPLMLIFPVYAWLRRGSVKTILSHTAIHAAGCFLGTLPLIFWLDQHELVAQFHQWVISFNSNLVMGGGRPVHAEVQFFLTLLGTAGCILLLRSENTAEKNRGRLLCVVIVLSAFIAMKPSKFHYDFYEQIYVLCMIAASVRPLTVILSSLIKNRRIVLTVVCVVLLIWPGVHETQRMIRSGAFKHGSDLIKTMQMLPKDEPVLCLPPRHPVTRFDACYISQGVLYTRWLSHPDIQAQLGTLADRLIQARPSIIFDRLEVDPLHRTFSETLFQHRLFSIDEKQQFDRFLELNYRTVQIEGTDFLLRRDIVFSGSVSSP